MARPNRSTEKRLEFLPHIARAFAELGYRRTTTAELARRCGVQETALYRLWPDKKAMFIAAIEFVYDVSATVWGKLLAESDGVASAAERLLRYESEHHGEFGYYRIVFAGLSELDDPEVRDALAKMYKRYHRFIEQQIGSHRGRKNANGLPSAALAAWGVIGLGTMASIGREIGLFGERQRQDVFERVGAALLGKAG